MSQKIQIGIFQFKKDVIEIDKKSTPIEVKVTMSFLSKKIIAKGYSSQKVNLNLNDKFEFQLFHKRVKTNIKWKNFIKKIASEGESILKYQTSNSESFVLLLKNGHEIYAIAGGYGHTSIQDYVNHDFGLEILSRILKSDEKLLVAVKEKNLTGGILGAIKFFRNNYNLNDNENFGNFYQELHASLNEKILIDKFGFTQNDIDTGSLCVAKSSFLIKKSISFDQMLEIVSNIEKLIKDVEPLVEINSVKKLGKADKHLIEKLNNGLDDKVWEIVKNQHDDDTSIELCHKDFDKYYTAQSYKLNFNQVGKKESIFDEPLKNLNQLKESIKDAIDIYNKKKFLLLLNKIKISSLDDSGNIETTGTLKQHYSAEFSENGQSYFYSNTEWYQIKPNFTLKLNELCAAFIKDNQHEKFDDVWDYPSENENTFNAKHLNKPQTLVFDKVTPLNIEACDIMKWDDQFVYFIHVKAGFDNTMRDLSLQVNIAAQKIQEDLKSGNKVYLTLLYNTLKNMKASEPYFIEAKKQLDSISLTQFLDIFNGRKPVFVLAVLDKASMKNTRTINDIELFESNIAKFSLKELIQNMRISNIGFRIVEIFKN